MVSLINITSWIEAGTRPEGTHGRTMPPAFLLSSPLAPTVKLSRDGTDGRNGPHLKSQHEMRRFKWKAKIDTVGIVTMDISLLSQGSN